jgi:hypothetical protein
MTPKRVRSGIQRKAYRAQPWSVGEKRYHKLIARRRHKIVRVLGSIQR